MKQSLVGQNVNTLGDLNEFVRLAAGTTISPTAEVKVRVTMGGRIKSITIEDEMAC